MYFFFDTETTGLPKNWKAPVTDLNNWPRMIQVGFITYDNKGHHLETKDYIIRPEGFTIPVEASNIHGITTERALDEGVALRDVLEELYQKIEASELLVAHNMAYDEKILGAEFLRNQYSNIVAQRNRLCTMQATVNYCNIQGPYGPKWPRLSELHIKLFGKDFEGAHNALADIQATADCFWKLKELQIIRL